MTQERPTFSPFWHRVRLMKPRLRPHVQITRQHYRGRRWHVVHDPTSNQFYRLNPIAHDFVGMLDGSRDVETAWNASLQKFGDAAPTQNEIIQLIGQLYQSNLLSVDTSPETEQLLRRGRERLKQKAAAQVIGIMYLKIRAFNPDRILTACEPILRPVLNRWGFIAWCALVLWAVYALVPHFSALARQFSENRIFDPEFLWLVPAAYVVTKAIHEFGHGVICKRFGGQVPEFGFMLLVMFPSPYVDASAAWAFPSKWQRIAVGAGGMMFELTVAALAAFAWVWSVQQNQDNSILARLSFNVMLSSSFATILFNANPLMRFDGYYILADLLEVPNLAQRSNKILLQAIQKHIYRLKNLTPPATDPAEKAILVVYGILAGMYRIFLFFSITLFILGQFFAIGLVLAIWTAAAWFILPVGKLIHWLASAPALAEHRARAVLTTLAIVALFAVGLGVIPMPDRRHGTGVVESTVRDSLHYGTDGFVLAVHKRPGDRVAAGDPIVTLENRELLERKRSMQSQLDEFAISERDAVNRGDPATVSMAVERITVARENLMEVNRRIDMLVVRAPHDGRVAGADPADRLGGFVKRGDPVCDIVDPSTVRVAATLDQRQAAWLFEKAAAESLPLQCDVRLISDVNQILPADRFVVVPAGQRVLPSGALGFSGGGAFETDSKDESGRVTKRPQFNVTIYAADPANMAALTYPGERVKVRFKLPNKPFLAQWLDRLHNEIQGRVHL
ncbi:MAG TPA: PqqD family peptide modification chaperone [Phycisphaerales bacterium]|nr:PqqD family peptide modification chaperone [Phycisphaerales bacterium]